MGCIRSISNMLCCGVTRRRRKQDGDRTKPKVGCDVLLLAHSANFIILTSGFVGHKIYLIRLCCAPGGEEAFAPSVLSSSPAVFKQGSADQRVPTGSARGFRKVVILFARFLTIYVPYVFKFAHKSVTQSQCIAWKCCRSLARQAFC